MRYFLLPKLCEVFASLTTSRFSIPDPEPAVLVVTQVRSRGSSRARCPSCSRTWARCSAGLVHVERGADAVAGAVPVVQPRLPHRCLPREGIRDESAGVLGENSRGESDVAL